MLRYKVYQIVTHDKFPLVAFIFSLIFYSLGIYVLLNPSQLAISSFISENALGPGSQVSRIDSMTTSTSLKEFTQFNNSSIFYFYHKSARTPGKDCIAILFNYDSGKIGLSLALTSKKFIESQIWGGDLLFIVYKSAKWAQDFRNFHYSTQGKFGVIRCYFEIDLNEKYNYVSLQYTGINNVQTDLDMLHAVGQLVKKMNFEVRIEEPDQAWPKNFAYSAASLKHVLIPDLDSPTSYLIGEGFVAVKIYTVSTGRPNAIQFLSAAGMVELIIRTFTALDENLHAGFYFYYLTAPGQVMPLSKFAFLIGALISPLMFQAILTLKLSWFSYDGLVALGLPYVSCYLSYVIARLWPSIPLLWVVPHIFWLVRLPHLSRSPKSCSVQNSNSQSSIYKSYSSLALGTTIGILSIQMLPLALLLSLLIPLKIIIRPYRSYALFSFLSLLFLILILSSLPSSLLELELNSNHYLYFLVTCGIEPVVIHLIQHFSV